MSALATAINTTWMVSCRRERRRFHDATLDLAGTQRAVLAEIVGADGTSAFGRDHGLHPACSYELFAEQVPVATYADLSPYLDRIAAGEHGVLTTDRVRLLQPTSGSTGGRKLIPYTRTLQRLLQRTIAAWIGDLFAGRAAVRRGRAYWSISPAFVPEPTTAGGLRIGFADDTEYLSGPERLAVRRVLAVPPDVTDSGSVVAFRRQTLAHLVTTPDLALISVWSPTFLLALVDELLTATDEVVDRAATLDPDRADRARRILGSAGEPSERVAALWPRLALISCWADGSSAAFIPRVEALFPTVELQPKGLLATEAFTSFPLLDRDGAALAARSHFFEFAPADGDARPPTGRSLLLGHQLSVGGRYKPVVTTGGGLWRYLIDDVVEVVGHEGQCPLLRFRGRAATSDLVGEKLDEAFVGEILNRVVDGDALLAPVGHGSAGDDRPPPSYVLLVDTSSCDPATAARVDAELRANPHYDYARRLGQLGPIELNVAAGTIAARYERIMIERGVRVGDIKPACLVHDPEVAAALTGRAE